MMGRNMLHTYQKRFDIDFPQSLMDTDNWMYLRQGCCYRFHHSDKVQMHRNLWKYFIRDELALEVVNRVSECGHWSLEWKIKWIFTFCLASISCKAWSTDTENWTRFWTLKTRPTILTYHWVTGVANCN